MIPISREYNGSSIKTRAPQIRGKPPSMKTRTLTMHKLHKASVVMQTRHTPQQGTRSKQPLTEYNHPTPVQKHNWPWATLTREVGLVAQVVRNGGDVLLYHGQKVFLVVLGHTLQR